MKIRAETSEEKKKNRENHKTKTYLEEISKIDKPPAILIKVERKFKFSISGI